MGETTKALMRRRDAMAARLKAIEAEIAKRLERKARGSNVKAWSPEERRRLVELTKTEPIDWEKVGYTLNRSGAACRQMWYRLHPEEFPVAKQSKASAVRARPLKQSKAVIFDFSPDNLNVRD